MRKTITLFSLAVLTIGLLGSCSKINGRIDKLEKRIDGLEKADISSVKQQIDGITVSINDLKGADATINGKIAELKAALDAQQKLIDALKEADKALGQKDEELERRIAALEGQAVTITGQIETLVEADKAINIRIDELTTYVSTELGKVGDWTAETFATLEQYQQTADELAVLSVVVNDISTTFAGVQTGITVLDTKIDGIDAALQGQISSIKTELEGKITSLRTELEGKIADAISTSETSIKAWINELLGGYYTAAQIDAKIEALNTAIANINGADAARIDSVASELTALKTAVDTAKAAIRSEYKDAIATAINKLDGEIRGALVDSIAAVNGRAEALGTKVTDLESRVQAMEGKVDKLLAMIQSVSITPEYDDGSVEAKDGKLTLKCIIRPAEALNGMASLKDSLLLYADSVKVRTRSSSAYMEIKVSEASILDAAQGAITLTADISDYMPKGEDKTLAVALNIKNGISNVTTEFVPVTAIITPYIEIAAKYDGVNVTTLKWSRQNIAITESGKKAWKGNNTSGTVKVPGTDEDVIVGDYFQWGAYAGYCGSSTDADKGLLIYTSFTHEGCGDADSGFTFKSAGEGKTYWFDFNRDPERSKGKMEISPYYNGSEYTKYNESDMATRPNLEASDDVANIILGGSWRMPTSAEFQALKDVTYWALDKTDIGYYVFAPDENHPAGAVKLITEDLSKSAALLFFPIADRGIADHYWETPARTRGFYWSSTLSTTNPVYCGVQMELVVDDSEYDSRRFAIYEFVRLTGLSVRPVSD